MIRLLLIALACVGFSACANRAITTVLPEAVGIGTVETVYAVSARKQLPDGNFGFERSEDLTLLELGVSVPPEYKLGDAKFGFGNPNPKREFTIAKREIYDDRRAFRRRVQADLNQLPKNEKEILLFVHGYNNTQIEVAYRAAQLKHDLDLNGVVMFYSWPSRGSPLGYAYDEDSALFARDGLENILRGLRRETNLPITLVAHSLGSQVTMETLRQIEIGTPGWTHKHLDGVVLMSPDLDVQLFRTEVARIKKLPQPFVIFANKKDHALGISQRVRGGKPESRLGNIASLDQISDLPVQVIDTSQLEQSKDLNHFPAANSPALIAMLKQAQETSETFELPDQSISESLPGPIARVGSAVRVLLTPPVPTH